MFPVSICEEQGLVYPVCCWKRKRNCLSELAGFFGMLFSSVSIREAVLIHSENLMKSSPFSLTSLLRVHPKTGQTKSEDSESIIEASLQKASCPTFLFLFSTQTFGCLC